MPNTPTVSRGDITIERDDAPRLWISESFYGYRWTAHLHGTLSTGERVRLSHYGRSDREALRLLEDAIKGSGWEIEGGFTEFLPDPPKTVAVDGSIAPPVPRRRQTFDVEAAQRNLDRIAGQIRNLRAAVAQEGGRADA